MVPSKDGENNRVQIPKAVPDKKMAFRRALRVKNKTKTKTGEPKVTGQRLKSNGQPMFCINSYAIFSNTGESKVRKIKVDRVEPQITWRHGLYN